LSRIVITIGDAVAVNAVGFYMGGGKSEIIQRRRSRRRTERPPRLRRCKREDK